MRSRSSKTDPAPSSESPRELPETVVVGYLHRPHGVRGELRVEIESDNPERFAPGSELIAQLPRRPGRRLRIARFRSVAGGGIVAFEGCVSREQAEELRGGRLEIERTRVPAAPPGLYYHYELVGCRCFEAAAGELGEVVDLVEDGGGHLLRIRRGGRELLVPFVEAFLRRVDVERGRIDLALPPGLLETCASGS